MYPLVNVPHLVWTAFGRFSTVFNDYKIMEMWYDYRNGVIYMSTTFAAFDLDGEGRAKTMVWKFSSTAEDEPVLVDQDQDLGQRIMCFEARNWTEAASEFTALIHDSISQYMGCDLELIWQQPYPPQVVVGDDATPPQVPDSIGIIARTDVEQGTPIYSAELAPNRCRNYKFAQVGIIFTAGKL